MPKITILSGKDDITSSSPERQRTARQRIRKIDPPPEATLELATEMAERVYHRTAQVRRGFIARASLDNEPPPLAQILRSGRGSSTRLRLYLSLLWIAAGDPHTVSGSAQAWATLLGLQDPAGKGARQVRSGFQWLAAHNLMVIEANPGVGSTVTLLSDLGTGEPYSVPGVAISKDRQPDQPADRQHFYVKLPAACWTKGWLHVLSGPAVAMLLVLLDAQAGRPPDHDLWFSHRVADERYTISEETRGRGFAELDAFEVISTYRSAVRSDQLGAPRVRHVYRLNLDRLETSPTG